MRRFFPLRPLVLTLAAGFPLACLADNDGEVAELRRQIQELTQRVDTHQSSLRVLAARWIELGPASGGRFELGTATLSVIGWERETRSIELWNEACHLD